MMLKGAISSKFLLRPIGITSVSTPEGPDVLTTLAHFSA